MKYDTYRDGGTKSFKANWFCHLIGTTEVCLSVDGEWTAGLNGRLLTEKEKSKIVPYIIKSVEDDVKWRTNFLNGLYESKRF